VFPTITRPENDQLPRKLVISRIHLLTKLSHGNLTHADETSSVMCVGEREENSGIQVKLGYMYTSCTCELYYRKKENRSCKADAGVCSQRKGGDQTNSRAIRDN
jgi:hypothetical protein